MNELVSLEIGSIDWSAFAEFDGPAKVFRYLDDDI